MEITPNQTQITTLDGVSPSKVSPSDARSINVSEVAAAKETENKVEQAKSADNLQASDLKAAVSQINDYVQNLQRNLQFTVDDVTGRDVVTIIDSESKEVIRQLPSEEALQLARNLAENSEDGVQIVSTQV